METKSQASVAVKVDGVEYTKIPVVGTLVFTTNPTKYKLVNTPEVGIPEIDLFCPDGTAFAFLIRGDMLDPVVPEHCCAVFSQDKEPVPKDFVLAQMKTGDNYFGRFQSFSDDKKQVLLHATNGEPVTLPAEDISLLSRMIAVTNDKKFGG